MKRLFPGPFPRQREQLALGKGTWPEALESPGDSEVAISGGPEMCQAWCPVCSRATSGHLDGARSRDHPSYVLGTSHKSHGVKLDCGGCLPLCSLLTLSPVSL